MVRNFAARRLPNKYSRERPANNEQPPAIVRSTDSTECDVCPWWRNLNFSADTILSNSISQHLDFTNWVGCDTAGLVLGQLRQQRCRAFEIGQVKSFCEPAMDRREQVVGFDAPTPIDAQSGKARGGA